MNHPLDIDSPREWLTAVLGNFNEFLIDHAANEKKASAAAMSMIAHYPDKIPLIEAMIDLALEELGHFRQVLKLMLKRGLNPAADEKDVYVNQLTKRIRRGPENYFLDRLLTAALIEARGAERFNLIAGALEDPELTPFYRNLARSEEQHHELFLSMANTYFPRDEINRRWTEWLGIEAGIITDLTIRPRLH